MPETDSAASQESESTADALNDGVRSLREALAYVRLLVATKLDRWKLSVLMLVLYIALGVFAAAAGIAVVATSVVLLLVGCAHGLGMAMGGRDWLGDIIVGFVLLVILTISITSVLDRFVSASRRQTFAKYDARHSRQRRRFGRDVTERAVSI